MRKAAKTKGCKIQVFGQTTQNAKTHNNQNTYIFETASTAKHKNKTLARRRPGRKHPEECVRAIRRWTRHPLGSARRGSNPFAVALVASNIVNQFVFRKQRFCSCRKSSEIAPTAINCKMKKIPPNLSGGTCHPVVVMSA
jgi:hypothetical protein